MPRGSYREHTHYQQRDPQAHQPHTQHSHRFQPPSPNDPGSAAGHDTHTQLKQASKLPRTIQVAGSVTMPGSVVPQLIPGLSAW